MKRLLPLFCILVILFASAGVASANSSQPDQFTISGSNTGGDSRTLQSGRTIYNLTAVGKSQGNLEGDFTGNFTFQEWGSVDFNPATGQGSGLGANTGLMTITKAGDPNSQVIIWFGGPTTLTSVRGNWHVVKGKGSWSDLDGEGTYASVYVDPITTAFKITFTGKFD